MVDTAVFRKLYKKEPTAGQPRGDGPAGDHPVRTNPAQGEIVAVALLDANELRNIATGFKRVYELPQDNDFDDLLAAIDRASRRSR